MWVWVCGLCAIVLAACMAITRDHSHLARFSAHVSPPPLVHIYIYLPLTVDLLPLCPMHAIFLYLMHVFCGGPA